MLVSPAEVTVEVLNGTGAPGAAGAAGRALEVRGFDVNGTGDAASFTYVVSVIEYPPGMEAEAETLAHYVVGSTSLSPDDSLTGQVLELVVGSSFRGILSS